MVSEHDKVAWVEQREVFLVAIAHQNPPSRTLYLQLFDVLQTSQISHTAPAYHSANTEALKHRPPTKLLGQDIYYQDHLSDRVKRSEKGRLAL